MAFEWVAGLFQSDNQQTRGLSGDQAHTVALDDSNPYYNFRLRRHKAEGDLVADPGLLWYTSPYVKRRSGLGTHVSAEVGEGTTATYTDVLLILSKEDHARASADWQQASIRALQQEFDNFCRRENFNRLHAHRPLGVRIIDDGSEAMGGQTLGLQRGEFITGILPNLYTGPVRGSYPVIGVHLNLPGVWDGYQEVGRLYNDQILFTLGNHWLDNFSHPSLQQAALYRLRQYPDGSFVHVVNPDLQDQYQVTSTNQGGASVLTLATRSGVPLAYMVLAVIDPPSARPSGRTGAPSATPTPAPSTVPTAPTQRPPSRPDIKVPLAPQPQVQRGEGLDVPSIAPPMLLDDASIGGGGLGGKTIIPDMPMERVFTLQERGALLQKVHFSNFMLGYDVYLGARGELGTHVENPAATFQVRRRSVSLVAHADNVVVGGRPVPAGVEVPIEGDVKIEVAGQKLEYRDLRGLQVDGWPYVGEIQRPASSTYMVWGEDYQIGRSRECRLVLPDEPRNDNIHWKPSVGDGATIRARTGEIPKSRFYTDSIMVASEHAGVDLRGEVPKAVCTARHCYVYVRRNGQVYPLFPATSPQQPKEMDLQPGDEVLVGNCLFYVGFSPVGEAVAPAPAPRVALADQLAQAVQPPNLEALAARTAPPPPPRGASGPEDLPRRDAAPAPPPREAVGMDSLVREAPNSRAPRTFPHEDVSEDTPSFLNESTTGALGVDGPIDIGDEDEPTVPGLVVPKEALESLAGLMADPALRSGYQPTEGNAAIEADISVDQHRIDVGGWDREDWEEEDSILSEPPPQPDASARPSLELASVPTPFPEMEQVEEDADDAVSDGFPPAVPPSRPPGVDATADLLDLGVRAPEPPPLPADAHADRPEDPFEDLTVDVRQEPPPLPVDTPPELPPALPPEAVRPPPLPEPQPESAPADSVAAPGNRPPDEPAAGTVAFTDDAEAQFELGRPLHLVLVGWTVNGEVSCGNHTGCALVLPENRIRPDQTFAPRTYFRLKVRGRKGHLEVTAPTEVRVDDAPPAAAYDDPEAHAFDVIRRDDGGEEDFVVRLRIQEDRRLPDPRARLVALVSDDPLASALVTRGIPKGAPRTLDLDGVSLTFLFDGARVAISDYLPTYRRGGAFHPFFVQRGDSRYTTAPEDGATIELSVGDRMVVGYRVYELRAE